MAHNIFGERFLGVRKPAWHSLGVVLENPIPAVDGLRLIDGDFEIVKAPMKVAVSTLFGTSLVDYENKFALVREPTNDSQSYEILGHCGSDYEIIQRRDFAAALDKLTDRWPLETIGILGKGEKVFFVLDAGLVDVGGEEVHQYFMVYDTVDGKTSAKTVFTPVRVVCENTCQTGLAQATMSMALSHTQGFNKDFHFRIDLISKMTDAQRLTIDTFEMLAKTTLVDAQVDAIFAAAYPYPTRPKNVDLVEAIDVTDEILGGLRAQGVKAAESYEYYCTRADGFRSNARDLFERMNAENSRLSGSAWYAWNAVTEMADWRDGAASVPESALFGQRLQEKLRAFKVAASFIA